MSRELLLLIVALTLGTSGGCGRGSTPEGAGASSPSARAGSVSMNKADYPVFPNADAGADPSVPPPSKAAKASPAKAGRPTQISN